MDDAFILDASALLCLLHAEPGAERVGSLLPRASISSVNLSEVAAKLFEIGMDQAKVTSVIEPLHLRTVPFDDQLAMAAGRLQPLTRHLGLSLGDRACLALAGRMRATALTTDRAWAQLGAGLAVEILR